MKSILVMLFMGISANLFSQKDNFICTIKAFDKNFVKVDSTLFSNKYEVTNVEYREFMADLLRNSKADEIKLATIDTNGWSSKLAYNEPYVELYYRHPAYQNYPLVNVSYDAAIMYCKWLTDLYNANPKRKFKKVAFRLPSIAEWEKAASGGNDNCVYPWNSPYLKNRDCMYLCNFNNMNEEGITYDTISKTYKISKQDQLGMAGFFNDHNDIPGPVTSYYPNDYGIYNMAGNVSEMVFEKGIAKGGSYKSPGYDVRIKSEEFYSKSAAHIGFRVFMEVLEK